jgi:ketosteroid isomerase-like protein
MKIVFPLLALALISASGAEKDKNKPVRHALEARYAELSRAIETRDVRLFEALRSPTFHTCDEAGRASSAVQMHDRTVRMFEMLRPPIQARFTLGTIDLRGDSAIVTVHQSFSRTQMIAGQPHRVETSVVQDETWNRTPSGWKLEYVDHEHDQLQFIDGKRVKPGAPYDPDAPAYDPEGTNLSPSMKEVRALERRWLDALERNDAAAVSDIITKDFVITYPDGSRQTRAQLLASLSPAAGRGPHFSTRDEEARAHGDTMILTGIVTSAGSGERSASAYTDTYVRSGSGWRVAASHLSSAPPAPPADRACSAKSPS